ncbi:MAG: hypothetical protein IJ391_00220 [Clostridia bacterium]|nr:hypothetical protein [Clostridia bacterium]
MRKMTTTEMHKINGGWFGTTMAIWTGICALFCWVMGKMGDWALSQVGSKKKR